MLKKYDPLGFLESDTFHEHMDLSDWVQKTAIEEYKHPKIYGFLQKAGTDYVDVLDEYPSNIATPLKVERGYCHLNNFLYAKILSEKQPEILHDFRFVTGLWLLKSKGAPPVGRGKYFVGGHTFMTYKGNVLDCTVLKFQSSYFFDVIQRFGISFSISDALSVFNMLEETNGWGRTPVLEAFYETSYLVK